MRAAEDHSFFFHAMTQDLGAAMRAGRRELVDRAFEAVERVALAVHDDLKRFVIVVSAGFASGHRRTSRAARGNSTASIPEGDGRFRLERALERITKWGMASPGPRSPAEEQALPWKLDSA